MARNTSKKKSSAVWGSVVFGGIFVVAGLIAFVGILVSQLSKYNTDWLAVAAGFLFLVTFGGAGGGLIRWALNKPSFEDLVKASSEQGLPSQEKGVHGVFYIIAKVLIVIALPVIVAGLVEGKPGVLGMLVFVLAAGAFYLAGRSKQRQYENIGPTLLQLNPAPGCIGGQVGGHFVLNHPPKNNRLNIRLSCLYTYSSGSGDNRSTHTSVLYQDETEAWIKPYGTGHNVHFVFDLSKELPDNLPETDSPKKKGTVSWEIQCTGMIKTPNVVTGTNVKAVVELKRSWAIPVTYGQETSQTVIPDKHLEQVKETVEKAAKESVSQQIDIQSSEEGLHLVSTQGRNRSMWGFLGAFGLGATAVGVFLSKLAMQGDVFWIMPIAFLGIGLYMLGFAVFLAGRGLETRISRASGGSCEVNTLRTLFGRQLYQRKGTLSSEDQLSLKTTMSSQDQNRDKTEYMAVFAMMGGRKVKLVEGIEGRRAGEAMIKTVSAYLGSK